MTRSRTCGTGAFQPSSRPTTSQNAMGTERCSGRRSTNARVYIRLRTQASAAQETWPNVSATRRSVSWEACDLNSLSWCCNKTQVIKVRYIFPNAAEMTLLVL